MVSLYLYFSLVLSFAFFFSYFPAGRKSVSFSAVITVTKKGAVALSN
jgi:hypothetical protein